jgi:hypothetical protein
MENRKLKSAPQGSIAALLEARLAELEGEYGAGTFREYEREATIFRALLGPRRELWKPAQVSAELMTQVVKRRASTLDPSTDNVRQCLCNLRFVLRGMGFTPECYAALEAPRRRRCFAVRYAWWARTNEW